MNALALAYKAAGGRLPSLRSRIWRVLADNQDRTSKQVAVQLNEPHNSVSSHLGSLADAGQATFVLELRNGYPRPVMVFRAVVAKDGTMPPPVKKGTVQPAKHTPAPAVKPAPKVEAPSPAPVVFTPPPAPKHVVVADLPLAEARRIYDELKSFFERPLYG